VTGWVRNEPDGSVLLEIQGDPHAVQGALTDIRKAMAGNIRNEQTTPLPDAPGETGFDILR
jgi:acylphosphatase